MPLVRIDTTLRLGPGQRRAAGDAVHRALVDTFKVPPDDRFQVIAGHGDEGLSIAPSYLGIDHGEDVVVVQITANAGRTVEMKRALFRRIADDLHAAVGVRREDVIVSLVEVAKENWSFGNGEAQYAT
ncbi:4-oxalocrotonate tautomerase [Anaeromyxobacter dehalogenans 2CP-1]|uniref:4-oxalocrotonate tautomerase n=1 Tax=Anaeromyxobacter dehalogenans (strain ATCC BAA-258 / DSM 21875 / 2CP-1) TaxID=455488 RepID=B8J697_ANAD2|nr:tautomerase family protein [Anaeromyxobacter dehalogenans]ACL65078.1 4-oxalocrotonate tautomerase [Anaeromyxobacter dehalogenans 2CP-1]